MSDQQYPHQDEELDNDPAYQEWSETIQQQNQQQQDEENTKVKATI